MSLPKSVYIRENGPREGFQIHPEFVPTEKKLELINALCKTGLKEIEITSFVRPDRVPQMADARELSLGLPGNSSIRFTALYLNEKGLERALECPKLKPEGYIMLAASDKFLQKNNNISIAEGIKQIPTWIELFKKYKIPFDRLMISTAFGDQLEGRISTEKVLQMTADALKKIAESGAKFKEVTFADTTGWGNPEQVRRLVAEFKAKFPEQTVGLHLHDTRGTGMANVYAGLLEGVEFFDASIAGLGGCPFTKDAAGNVPTEDVAFLCEEMGIKTGLDLSELIQCAKLAEQILGKTLPGKLKQGGLLKLI
jgi:hydroxymethylglutaryl-CoA lyase